MAQGPPSTHELYEVIFRQDAYTRFLFIFVRNASLSLKQWTKLRVKTRKIQIHVPPLSVTFEKGTANVLVLSLSWRAAENPGPLHCSLQPEPPRPPHAFCSVPLTERGFLGTGGTSSVPLPTQMSPGWARRGGPRRRGVHGARGGKCGTVGQRENARHRITVFCPQGQALREGLKDLSGDRDSSRGHKARDCSGPSASRPSSKVLLAKPALPPRPAPPEQVSGMLLCPCTHDQAPGDLTGSGKPSPWWEATAVKPAGTHRSRLLACLQPGRATHTTHSADVTATVFMHRLNWSLFLHREQTQTKRKECRQCCHSQGLMLAGSLRYEPTILPIPPHFQLCSRAGRHLRSPLSTLFFLN